MAFIVDLVAVICFQWLASAPVNKGNFARLDGGTIRNEKVADYRAGCAGTRSGGGVRALVAAVLAFSRKFAAGKGCMPTIVVAFNLSTPTWRIVPAV